MNKKQLDHGDDGLKLSDSQLDRVIGGLNMPPRQAVDLMSAEPKPEVFDPVRPAFNLKH